MMARMRWTMINAMICIMMYHKIETIEKEIIIYCLVWSTRKMSVHNWKLTETYYLIRFGLK